MAPPLASHQLWGKRLFQTLASPSRQGSRWHLSYRDYMHIKESVHCMSPDEIQAPRKCRYFFFFLCKSLAPYLGKQCIKLVVPAVFSVSVFSHPDRVFRLTLDCRIASCSIPSFRLCRRIAGWHNSSPCASILSRYSVDRSSRGAFLNGGLTCPNGTRSSSSGSGFGWTPHGPP